MSMRRSRNGEFCTLPHVIELMQLDYDSLFTCLRTEKEIEVLITPFVNANLHDVMEQLEGQIAAAKVAMARLSAPQLYYVLSGSDFTLDINRPDVPKIVCMCNNPQKIQVYGAVLSLYVTRLVKQVNRKGMRQSSLVFDEFPTRCLSNMDSLIGTEQPGSHLPGAAGPEPAPQGLRAGAGRGHRGHCGQRDQRAGHRRYGQAAL